MQTIRTLIVNTSKHPMPKYGSLNASGFDIRANVEETTILKPGQRLAVPTGLFMQFPVGYELQIRPRSGVAFKNGVTVLNSPGTIDQDYKGEIKVIMINLTREEFKIEPGDRIAQGVLAPVVQAAFVEVTMEQLEQTERGAGGFGSTGSK
jgi:dUTP pyrophosphatase